MNGAAAQLSNGEIVPGPMWRRVVAALLDLAIVISVFVYTAQRWGVELDDGKRGWSGLPALFVFLLMWAYWFVPEWLFAATVGKAICDLRVAPAGGGKSSFVRALQRNLLRPVDFFFFCLVGFIVAMSNPRRQRLGDLWARTVVVSSVIARENAQNA
jgi:uncharacterized RDD family membrane protein YckC